MSFLLGIIDSHCWKFVEFPNWVSIIDSMGIHFPNVGIKQQQMVPISLVGYFVVPRLEVEAVPRLVGFQ